MDICFLGTPEFAVPILKNLINNHKVNAVITQPDKAKGRGKKIIYSPVKNLALENNIDIYQPEKIKDNNFVSKLYNIKADIFIVVAYGQILSEEILEIPKYGCINVHGSLLPKFRGAAPIQWSIIKGEKKTGITIIQMDTGLDTGDILLQKRIDILDEDNAKTLYHKLSLLASDTILEVIDKIKLNRINRVKQNENEATYAPILKKELGHIDWSKNNKEIINLVRGLNLWPGTYSYLNNNLIKILKCKEYEFYNREHDKKFNYGEIIENDPNIGIVVKTKEGSLLLEKIQLNGKKEISSKDFLRGNKVDKGTILL